MIKYLLILIFGMFSGISIAQFGLSGGVSVLKAFGTPKPYVGFHLGGEIPRDDQVSLYGRIAFYGKQKEDIENFTYVTALDPTTNPNVQMVGYKNSFNYTILEGGTRYYIGDGYDSGFGAYGGGNVAVVFNTVKRSYGDYDQSKYELSSTELPKGSIFNLGFGLGGGLKHTLAGVGTFYFDASFSYLILSIGSNSTAQSGGNMYSPILFAFNLGFRKDLY